MDEPTLRRLHLQPKCAPVACMKEQDGRIIYYYHPDKVKEADPTGWYKPTEQPPEEESPERTEPAVTGELHRITGRRAESLGYYSAKALAKMYYEPIEPPVACYIGRSGKMIPLYNKATCRRLPLPCIACGNAERYRAKLCRSCYAERLAERRREGDLRRGAKYGKDPKRVLFFDMEMTGVFERDEVLSVSVMNGEGEPLFESLIHPVRNKRWKRTEQIHGITPDMVKDAPTFAEITPRLRAILSGADHLVAYGTATDFMHLCRICRSREEREQMRSKLIDCAAEFSHYVAEHEIGLVHQSLGDAMTHFGLSWEGLAHTSAADTAACRLVFSQLYPHFYEREEA